MKYYLSIDAGGTKVQAILFDENYRLVSSSRAGGLNPIIIPPDIAYANCKQCFSELFYGLNIDNISCYYKTIAGFAAKETLDTACLCEFVRCDETIVISEGVIGLLSCGIYPHGVLVLSGTGSDVFYIKDLKIADFIGGWGGLLGCDEGSGFSIGRKALRAAYQVEDGYGEPTALSEKILNYFNVDSLRKVNKIIYSSSSIVSAVAPLNRLVEQAAQEGDRVANRILKQEGEALALQAITAIRRNGLSQDTPVCYIGGALKHHSSLRNIINSALHQEFNMKPMTPPVFEPVVGSVLYHIYINEGGISDDALEYIKREYADFLCKI